MRRIMTALLCITMWCTAAFCQEIVIDPSQIAASAENTAEQIDYMIRQINEITSLGDKVSSLREYAQNSFGEDLAGAAELLRSLGTLDRLAAAYSERIDMIASVSKQAGLLSKEGLSNITALADLLEQSISSAKQSVDACRRILSERGFTKKEKKDMIESIVKDIENGTTMLRETSSIETGIALNAKAISDLCSIAENHIGEEQAPARMSQSARVTGMISVVLMLCAVVSLVWGYSRHCQGDDNVFIRIGAGILACIIILGVLSRVFGI